MNKIIRFSKFMLIIILILFTFSLNNLNAAIVELPNQNQVPNMITMSLFEDSTSQMAFNWNTNWETNSDLQIVVFGNDFSSSSLLKYKGTTEKSKVENDGFIHQVIAKDLAPGTKYSYRLGDEELGIWSTVGTFTTASGEGSFNFIHISDPQGYEENHYVNYQELLNKSIEETNPEFIALTGDIVNDSYKDSVPVIQQWNWALTMQRDIIQNIPVMACAGNHDAADHDFNSRFNFPTDEQSEMVNGSYYSYDYNNVHFIVLNTNDSSNTLGSLKGLSDIQINWLINDLETNKNSTFTIVMMHKGIYDAGGHCSNKDGEDGDSALIRNQLTPIFTKYNVDLVLQGHDHLYSRSYPISGQFNGELSLTIDTSEKTVTTFNGLDYHMYNNPNGPIYLNSGTASGSKYYSVVDYDSEKIPIENSDSSSDRMFTDITIEDSNLYATVYKLSNGKISVFDTFGISKNSVKQSSNEWIYYTVGAVVTVLIACGIVLIVCKRKGKL